VIYFDLPGVMETEEGGYQCLECGARMKHLKNYKRHLLDRHSGPGAHPCTYCGKAYGSNNSLVTHMYTYHKDQYLMDKRVKT
jgi:uncharacterized Zn-finger protein